MEKILMIAFAFILVLVVSGLIIDYAFDNITEISEQRAETNYYNAKWNKDAM